MNLKQLNEMLFGGIGKADTLEKADVASKANALLNEQEQAQMYEILRHDLKDSEKRMELDKNSKDGMFASVDAYPSAVQMFAIDTRMPYSVTAVLNYAGNIAVEVRDFMSLLHRISMLEPHGPASRVISMIVTWGKSDRAMVKALVDIADKYGPDALMRDHMREMPKLTGDLAEMLIGRAWNKCVDEGITVDSEVGNA